MKSPRETREILDKLEPQHPGADTELHFKTAFELLAATILSAQSTDALVNTVTPALFKRYPDARALARATSAELEPQIHSTGFFGAKSTSLIGMAQALVEQHDGEVPATMEALVALPGVGRKTANVVLGHALGIPGLPVDRHVLRVANRIGIAESDDPIVVEQQLCDALPPERWTRTSDTLILHGRRICRPKPLCDQCFVRDECDYYRLVVSRERDPGATRRSAAPRKPPTALRARTGAAKRAAGAVPGARSTPKPQPTGGGRTRGPAPAKKRKASGAKRVRKARR
jgi:endonuclease-3